MQGRGAGITHAQLREEKKMDRNQLIKKVESWARERGLDRASYRKQLFKMDEEALEIIKGHIREDLAEVKDGLGDTYVTVIVLALQLGLDFESILATVPALKQELRVLSTDDKVHRLTFHLHNLEIWTRQGVSKFDLTQEMADMLDLLRWIARDYGWDLENCLAAAYEVIKNRKGKLVGGVFVKEEDLND